MTTIAYVKGMLAADSQITHGSIRVPANFKKLNMLPGAVMAYTGDIGVGGYVIDFVRHYIEFFRNGSFPEDELSFDRFGKNGPDDTQFILMTKSRCFEFDVSLVPQDITKFPAAFGTGKDIAYAAMVMGKTAREAVAVACKLDIHSSKPVRWITQKDL